MREVPPSGPIPARIMIVGEAPGEHEVNRGIPFVGPSGELLNKTLEKLGVNRESCFVTNVARIRPPANDIGHFIALKKCDITPEHRELNGKMVLEPIYRGYELLLSEIDMVKPEMIITLGNTPLWALTGLWGITKWRGSMLQYRGINLLPTYHPAAILRQWDWRPAFKHDLRRAVNYVGKPWPVVERRFTIEPGFKVADEALRMLLDRADRAPLLLSTDIETRAYNTACLGMAWTRHDAICLPFMTLNGHYWSRDNEVAIVTMLYKLLTHPNVLVIGQNFIYDAQYLHRYWHFYPPRVRDTMLAHHVLFPALPKSLDFICSMHNEQYVFWKDDGKTLSFDGDLRKHWSYNCEDTVRTLEADESLQATVDGMGLRGPHDFQQRLYRPVLNMMLRGVRLDFAAQRKLAHELERLGYEAETWLRTAIGYELNPKSPKQMVDFFYNQLALPRQYQRARPGEKPSVTCDSPALAKLAKKQPIITPIVQRIEDLRSIGVFRSNFLADKRDMDGRMRCSYNIAGTKTFRFSSSENAFGSGLNMENIPGEDKE